MAAKIGTGTQKKVRIALTVGTNTAISQKIFELRNVIAQEGGRVFGPDFKKLIDSPFFTRKGVAFSQTPRGMKTALGNLYEQAWLERYDHIASQVDNTEATTQWKKDHQGYQPYADSTAKIRFIEPAFQTGNLQESVAATMKSLKDSKFLKFRNLTLQAGWDVDLGAFPHKKDDPLSYVAHFVDFLRKTGVLESDEELITFTEARWTEIAQVMREYAEREFLKSISDYLNPNGYKR